MLYDANFYSGQSDNSRSSASIVVPIITQAIRPDTVVDIGCGLGSWPKTFADLGCSVAHGVDGPWVDPKALCIPEKDFFQFDFEQAVPPFDLPLPRKRYDLVTSFEFIEHVDQQFADPLVDMFCSLSDVLVIGGAIPYQGGLHHVNEQWPQYWREKFAARGFEACDFIRPQVWTAGVEPWYAQNTIAYFKNGVPAGVKKIAARAWEEAALKGLPLVHPGLWISKSTYKPEPISSRMLRIPRRIAGKAKRLIMSS